MIMVEFLKQSDVDAYVDNLSVFENKGELYMKVGENIGDYILVESKRQKILDYVDKNTSPFATCIANFTVKFPILDLKIFDDYKQRELAIKRNKKLLDEIKSSKKYLKRGWRLICLQKPIVVQNNERIRYIIYDFQNNTWNWIRDEFLEDSDKKNSTSITNLVRLKKIGSETFENQYKAAFEFEKKKWDEISVFNMEKLDG